MGEKQEQPRERLKQSVPRNGNGHGVPNEQHSEQNHPLRVPVYMRNLLKGAEQAFLKIEEIAYNTHLLDRDNLTDEQRQELIGQMTDLTEEQRQQLIAGMGRLTDNKRQELIAEIGRDTIAKDELWNRYRLAFYRSRGQEPPQK